LKGVGRSDVSLIETAKLDRLDLEALCATSSHHAYRRSYRNRVADLLPEIGSLTPRSPAYGPVTEWLRSKSDSAI
jgi:hypothetical protein